jgi:hypothetical protein
MTDKDEIKKSKSKINDASRRRKFKKLRHKALYLNIEYEEVLEIFEEARTSFIGAMHEYCAKIKKPPPFAPVQEEPKDKKKSSDKNKPEDVSTEEEKSIYREIVLLTHPDKTSGLSKHESDEREELYREAVQGKESGDLGKLLSIAFQLDIDITEISPEFLKNIRKEIKKTEQKIKKMKSDIMYQWFNASQEHKDAIFRQLVGE